MRSLRTLLSKGLLVIVPLVVAWVTLKLVWQVLAWVLGVMPPLLTIRYWLGLDYPPLEWVLLLVYVMAVGWLAQIAPGRWLSRQIDTLVGKIPLMRSLYSGVKETLLVLFSAKRSFKQVVMIPYPSQGSWSLAFLTNDFHLKDGDELKDSHVAVFLPTTPNPTSGFILVVKKSEIKYLSISVEDALKFVISLGSSGSQVMTEFSQHLSSLKQPGDSS